MARRERKRFTARPLHPLTGRRFRLSADTERELGAYLHRLDQLRTDLRLGLLDVGEADAIVRRILHGATTLARALDAYLARTDLADNTRRRVRSLARAHLRTLLPLELSALDAPRVSRWISGLTLAPSSARLAWWTLRAIVSSAAERGWIGALPWGAFRPRSAPRSGRRREAARTVLELAALCRAAAELEKENGARWVGLAAKIAVTALLGLRQGELAGLRWGDFRITAEGRVWVVISRQYRGAPLKRSARPSTLAVPPELAEILRAHGAACESVAATAPVFAHEGLGDPTAFRARQECLPRVQVRAAAARAGLPNPHLWTVHSLRDTFATLEAEAHGDLWTVAQRTRHRSLQSLARYLRTLREPPPPGARLPLELTQRGPVNGHPVLPPHV